MGTIDYGQLCRILECFSSADNNLRKEAEDAFNSYKETHLDELLLGLVRIMMEHENHHTRGEAAICIRTVLRPFTIENDATLWNRLNPQTKSFVLAELLRSLEHDANGVVRNNVAVTVSVLGARLTSAGEWPELNARLIAMIETDNYALQECGLNILSDIVPHISTVIRKNIGGIHRMISNCAKSRSYSVRCQCLNFISSLVLSEPRSIWKRFQNTLPDLVEGITTKLDVHESDDPDDYFSALVMIADADAGFFKPYLVPLVQTLLNFARGDQTAEVRHMAVEVLLCIAENKPLMCLKVSNFVMEMVGMLLGLMLSVDEEGKWIDNEDSDSSCESTGNYDVGESGLDRLAAALGGENTINVVFHYASEYLRKEEWQYKLVAVMAISQTAEYLPEDNLEAHLEEIVNTLLVQLKDSHHRVRFAACEAIGQISLDQQPLLQKSYANVILPALIAAIDDPLPKVQSNAIRAMVNFTEEVDIADLMPYTDTLMQKLFERVSLENCSKELRSQSVTGIAVIAGVLKKNFLKYYPIVVPAIKEIIQKCVSDDEQLLRGKAAECVSIIGLSVGAEVFEADAHEVMQMLIAVAAHDDKTKGTSKEYVQEAFCRICRTLKGNFYPYLQHLMPSILKTLSDTTVLDMKKQSFRNLRTSAIQEMDHTLDLLTTIIQAMEDKFKDFLLPTAQTLIPLLDFQASADIKSSAIVAMSEIIQLSQGLGVDRSVLSAWTSEVLEKVFRNLSLEEDDEVDAGDLAMMAAEVGGLAKCLRNAGPNILTGAQVNAICTKVFVLMKESTQRRAKLALQKEDPEYDDEDVSRIEDEEDSEQTFRSTLLEIVAAIMKLHPELYLQHGAPLSQEFITAFLHPNCSPDDRALALYVCDDILEHLKDVGAPLWPIFAEQLINSVLDSDPGVRQGAAYGVIQAAHCSQFPAELIQQAVANLVAVLAAPTAKDKSDLPARDNVIAALGAIVLHAGMRLKEQPQQYLQLWIDNLPLKVDDEEARSTHKDLIDLILKGNTEVLGPNNANVPKLTAICAAIYKTDLSTSEIDEGIRTFVQSIGFEIVQRLGAGFQKKLQQQLERIHRDVMLGETPTLPS